MKCPECDSEMIEKIVRKENENKGRHFWSCQECGQGFKWITPEIKEEPKPNGQVPAEVWEAKDRLGSMQTAVNAVSVILAAKINSGEKRTMQDFKRSAYGAYAILREAQRGEIEPIDLDEIDF